MATEPDHRLLSTAERRFDSALTRLDGSLSLLTRRLKALAKAETDLRAVASDRNRLVGDLDKASVRAKALDDGAGEVARRLVKVMEEVRGVLDKGSV